MSVQIVRLGSPRKADEGVRIGTVRRPPRGVPKAKFAADDWYDVWFPILAPSLDAMKSGLVAETAQDWTKFARRYRKEMSGPGARHAIQLLAKMSHTANFSVGCYCAREDRCHRSILRELLRDAGALMG